MTTPILGLDEWESGQISPSVPVNAGIRGVEAVAVPQPNFQTGVSYELVLGDLNVTVYVNNTAHTLNIPDNATVPFPIGTKVRLVNEDASNAITVTDDAAVTWRGKDLVSSGIAAGNYALIEKTATDEWMVLEYGAVPT